MFKDLSFKEFFRGFGLWLAWMATLAIIWIAQVFYLGLMAFFAWMGGRIEEFTQSISLNRSAGLFAFFVFIFSLSGLFQWLILLKKIRRAAFWILATGAGSLVGMLIGSFVPYLGDKPAVTNFELQMAITGVVICLAQWFVIRRSMQNSYLWVIAGVIGWPLLLVGFGPPFGGVGMVAVAMVISTCAVLLFNRSTQRQFNALALSSLSVVILIVGGISLEVITARQNLQEQISTYPATSNFNRAVYGVAFSPDGNLIAAEAAGEELTHTIKIWEISSGNELLSLSTETTTSNISFSSDGLLFAAAYDLQSVRVWGVDGKESLPSLQMHESFQHLLAFSPSERLLAIASVSKKNSGLTIGDPVEGTMRRIPAVNSDDYIRRIAFNPAGELMVAWGEKVEWWDVSTAEKIREIAKPNPSLETGYYAFSPDGKYLVEVGGTQANPYDNIAYIWDLNQGGIIQQFEAGRGRCAAFSPDGNILAFGRLGDEGILLWDVKAGEKLKILRGGAEKISIAFSPDGKLLATGSIDGEVMLWEVPQNDK